MESPQRESELLDKYGIAPPPCGAVIPEGWQALVERLIVDLIAHGWNRDCQQIKEKFGGLRFYIGDGDEVIRNFIAEAGAKSETLCVVCGATCTVKSHGGWLSPRCDTHTVSL